LEGVDCNYVRVAIENYFKKGTYDSGEQREIAMELFIQANAQLRLFKMPKPIFHKYFNLAKLATFNLMKT